MEYPFDFTYIAGFQKEQFPLLSHLDRNVDVLYSQKMEVEMQKLWYKTSSVALGMGCIARFDVLKELFFYLLTLFGPGG